MARGAESSNRHVVLEAWKGMNRWKYEIANEIGISNQVRDGYWGEIPSRDCGAVGGHMVKRMVEAYERQLAGGTAGGGAGGGMTGV